MMVNKAVLLSYVWTRCLVQKAYAVGTDDQVNANLDYGTFQDPSSNVRPRFRYWPPDASVNLGQVADDVREAGRVGAGGIELLGYYLYGGPHPTLGGYVPVDWTTYGWGTPAWKELQDTALSTASENGLLIDLSLGADQGAGVPAPADSDGLLWELIAYNVTIAQGGTFDGILPGWGSGDFVSASSALILSSVNNTETGQMNITISASSLTDITSSVSSTGYVTANFPANTTGLYYTLFAYYQKTSGYREVISPTEAPGAPQSPVETYVQNGSWVVDHFSTLGAQVVIDFWEQYLLTNSTKDLIKQVGNYMWEDSQEYGTGVQRYWTPQFSSTFLANRGYSINKYLPLVPLVDFPGSPTVVWFTDEADGGVSHVYDYRQTLTELNQLYLEALTEWSIQSLDIQFSAQVAYNLPMDMLANIPYVNAPECESLGFSDLIDAYRQFAGPANLAGKRIVSSELGAVYGKAYQQTIPDILFHIKRSVAGSINQFVLHGYPYSGNYPNTTWPGFTTFAYLFSEMHGRHQPAWDFYSDFLDFTARTQFIAQSGVPRIDLVFWSKLDYYVTVPTQYDSSDLEEAGYSYEYLSPDNFVLPEAYVADGVLAPNRQAFKALIVRANDTLTPFGVTKLAEFAENGLPIIFSGGVPSTYGSYNQTGVASAKATITQLTSLENVHTVSYTGLAASLSSLSILPRTVVNANSTWYTYWRTDNASETEYIYIYNDANTVPAGQGFSTGNITFATTGTPYTYDAWTGSIAPINIYQQTSTTTTIPFQLAGNQSTIVAFKLNETQSSPHVQQCSSNILSTTSTSNNSITLLRTYDQQSQTCELSTGTSITLNPMLTPGFELSNWTLTIESWKPPTDLSDIQTIAIRTNTTYNLPTLIPWNQIPDADLSNTSGRGYYSTQFQWPPSTSTSTSASNTTTTIGVIINLGSIFHTARLFINGNTIPPLDTTLAKTDITSFLNDGVNDVEVVVSTPLSNTLRGIWDEIKSSGVFATDFEGVDPPASVGYGLLDQVVVSPYEGVEALG